MPTNQPTSVVVECNFNLINENSYSCTSRLAQKTGFYVSCLSLSSCPVVQSITYCMPWLDPLLFSRTVIITIIAVALFIFSLIVLCLLSIFLSSAVLFPFPSRRRLDNDLNSFFSYWQAVVLLSSSSSISLLLNFLATSPLLSPSPSLSLLLQPPLACSSSQGKHHLGQGGQTKTIECNNQEGHTLTGLGTTPSSH